MASRRCPLRPAPRDRVAALNWVRDEKKTHCLAQGVAEAQQVEHAAAEHQQAAPDAHQPAHGSQPALGQTLVKQQVDSGQRPVVVRLEGGQSLP